MVLRVFKDKGTNGDRRVQEEKEAGEWEEKGEGEKGEEVKGREEKRRGRGGGGHREGRGRKRRDEGGGHRLGGGIRVTLNLLIPRRGESSTMQERSDITIFWKLSSELKEVLKSTWRLTAFGGKT